MHSKVKFFALEAISRSLTALIRPWSLKKFKKPKKKLITFLKVQRFLKWNLIKFKQLPGNQRR